METTYELETHLELPVTVEYVCGEGGVGIIRITVRNGVEGIVGDLTGIQDKALREEIDRQLEAESADKLQAKAVSEAADRQDALEFKADCERDNKISDQKNEDDLRDARVFNRTTNGGF